MGTERRIWLRELASPYLYLIYAAHDAPGFALWQDDVFSARGPMAGYGQVTDQMRGHALSQVFKSSQVIRMSHRPAKLECPLMAWDGGVGNARERPFHGHWGLSTPLQLYLRRQGLPTHAELVPPKFGTLT
jgi:hypothetical protein